MMEANLVIGVAILALWHPSFNGICHFWMYMIMLHPMTMHVRQRYRWGMFYLIILTSIEFIWFIIKIVQVKHFKDTFPGAQV